jgi:hypothetical protein
VTVTAGGVLVSVTVEVPTTCDTSNGIVTVASSDLTAVAVTSAAEVMTHWQMVLSSWGPKKSSSSGVAAAGRGVTMREEVVLSVTTLRLTLRRAVVASVAGAWLGEEATTAEAPDKTGGVGTELAGQFLSKKRKGEAGI